MAARNTAPARPAERRACRRRCPRAGRGRRRVVARPRPRRQRQLLPGGGHDDHRAHTRVRIPATRWTSGVPCQSSRALASPMRLDTPPARTIAAASRPARGTSVRRDVLDDHPVGHPLDRRLVVGERVARRGRRRAACSASAAADCSWYGARSSRPISVRAADRGGGSRPRCRCSALYVPQVHRREPGRHRPGDVAREAVVAGDAADVRHHHPARLEPVGGRGPRTPGSSGRTGCTAAGTRPGRWRRSGGCASPGRRARRPSRPRRAGSTPGRSSACPTAVTCGSSSMPLIQTRGQ